MNLKHTFIAIAATLLLIGLSSLEADRVLIGVEDVIPILPPQPAPSGGYPVASVTWTSTANATPSMPICMVVTDMKAGQ